MSEDLDRMSEDYLDRAYIRTRFQLRYSDGSASEWRMLPNPENPAFTFTFDSDDDEPPFVHLTESYKKDEESAKIQGIDEDALRWSTCYLSGYASALPVRYNERVLQEGRLECDIDPNWTLSYTYDYSEGIYNLNRLVRNDRPHPRVSAVGLEMDLFQEEYDMLMDFLGSKKDPAASIVKLLEDGIKMSNFDLDKQYRDERPRCSSDECPAIKFSAEFNTDQFFWIHQIVYAPSRELADFLMGLLIKRSKTSYRARTE